MDGEGRGYKEVNEWIGWTQPLKAVASYANTGKEKEKAIKVVSTCNPDDR